MTVESLTNTFTEYVTWLYTQRQWARWELLTIALTVMVLLLFILVLRRRAKTKKTTKKRAAKKSSTIGVNLDVKGDSLRHGTISVSKNKGNQNRWKQTTKKWKNLQKLIEQLHEETTKYKEAEELLIQQFARLKEANELLGKEIAGSEQISDQLMGEPEAELSRPRNIGSPGKAQSRIINRPGVRAKES